MRFCFLLIPTCLLTALFGSCSRETKEPIIDSTVVYSEFHDFECVTDPRIDSAKSVSGKKCGLLNEKIEYSFGLEKQIKNISSYKSINEVGVSFICFMPNPDSSATLVFSIDDTVAGKNMFWDGKKIKPVKYNEWSPVTNHFKVSKKLLKPEYVLKLYIWNKEKKTFYFDDISFFFIHKSR